MGVQTRTNTATIESIKEEMKSLGWEPARDPSFSVDKYGSFDKVVTLDFKTIEKHTAPCCGLPHYGQIGFMSSGISSAGVMFPRFSSLTYSNQSPKIEPNHTPMSWPNI